jgi:hypothetical protein
LADPGITKFMETQGFSKNYMSAPDMIKMMQAEDEIYKAQFTALGLKK